MDPDAEITLLTRLPDRDRRRLGVTPLQRGILGVPGLLRAARRADLVIGGCGGLFQDDDSLLKMPYWALRLALIRPFAKRMVGLSIGAGPLHHMVSRIFARLALATLDLVSTRDALARDVLQPLTRKPVSIVPDPAFALRSAREDAARQALIDASVPVEKPMIGVAVRRWFHTDSNLVPHKYATRVGLYRNRGRTMMAAFIDSTARALNDVMETSDLHVVFMPTYNVDHENDAAVCEAIGAKLRPGSYTVVKFDDPAMYKAATGLMSVMLCGRMHPAILAASQGTPVVGMAYNQKFHGMFSMLAQNARCLCMAEFTLREDVALLAGILKESLQHPGRYRPDTRALERQTHSYIERLVTPPDCVRTQLPVPHPERN